MKVKKGKGKYVVILTVLGCLLFVGGNRVTVYKTLYGNPQEEIQRTFGGLMGTVAAALVGMTSTDNNQIEDQHEVNRRDLKYGRFCQGFMLAEEKGQGRSWIVYPDCIAEVSLEVLDETGMPEHVSWYKENKMVYYVLSAAMLGSY